MRAEMLEKSNHLASLIGEEFKEVIVSLKSSNVEQSLKAAFRKLEGEIRQNQSNQNPKLDGYILYQDVVYKVYSVNSVTSKITGAEAKEFKRKVKFLSKETSLV